MTAAATRIRDARARAGMTQSRLAELSGVAQPKLSAYERGTIEPKLETLDRILAVAKLRPSTMLERNADAVIRIGEAHHIVQIKVFGSAVHGTDTVLSDIDLLVTVDEHASLLDISGFENEVGELLGYPVDVVSENAPPNPVLDRIRAEAVPL